MRIKKYLAGILLIGVIYGFGHLYFAQKAPAILKIALHTIEKSGLKVEHGPHKTGNYLFRPYVELSHLNLTSQNVSLPSLTINTSDPTRFMLNWWKGQSLTITNKGTAAIAIKYPHFQYLLTPQWLTVTVDGLDAAPQLRNMVTDKLHITFLEQNTQRDYNLTNVSIKKMDKSNKNSELNLVFSDFSKNEKDNQSTTIIDQATLVLDIPEVIKHPFQANWFIILAQTQKSIVISNLSLAWQKAVFNGHGVIKVDVQQMPHIILQTSMADFEAFLANLENHPLFTPIILKTWQAVLSILKATTQKPDISFEYKERSLYINGIQVVKNLDI